MKSSRIRAIFFDAGNTLPYIPGWMNGRLELTEAGFPARVEDFHVAERAAKQKLDVWLWPLIRRGELPRTIDHYYWAEYLSLLMGLIDAPETEHARLINLVASGFRDIRTWSLVLPETPPSPRVRRPRATFLESFPIRWAPSRVNCRIRDCATTFRLSSTPRSWVWKSLTPKFSKWRSSAPRWRPTRLFLLAILTRLTWEGPSLPACVGC